jgi:hypothetical protein
VSSAEKPSSKKSRKSNSGQTIKSSSGRKGETHYQKLKREKLEKQNEKIKLLAAEQQLIFAKAKQREEESTKLFDAAQLNIPWANTQYVSNNLSLPKSSNTTDSNRLNRINLSQIQIQLDKVTKTSTTNAGCSVISNKSPPKNQNNQASSTNKSPLPPSSTTAPSPPVPLKKASPTSKSSSIKSPPPSSSSPVDKSTGHSSVGASLASSSSSLIQTRISRELSNKEPKAFGNSSNSSNLAVNTVNVTVNDESQNSKTIMSVEMSMDTNGDSSLNAPVTASGAANTNAQNVLDPQVNDSSSLNSHTSTTNLRNSTTKKTSLLKKRA